MKPQHTDQRTGTATTTTRATRNRFFSAAVMVATTAAVAVGNSGPIGPAPLPGMANFIDWDLPALTAGSCPSAIGAVTLRPPTGEPVDPVYYVTLCPQNPSDLSSGPNLVELRAEMHPQPALWRAWNIGASPTPNVFDPALLELPALTGGIRLSSSGRAFVRTQSEIVRFDLTRTPAPRTRWQDVLVSDDPAAQSDVALVDRSNGYTDVWTTHNSSTLNPGSPGDLTAVPPQPPVLPTPSPMPPGTLQRLTVSNNSNTATVTRWAVDGGAGLHYLSGVVVFEGKVYYSEGDPVTDQTTGRGNSIAVLDPDTNHVHRFSLSKVDPTVSSPRQISVDPATRTFWIVTQSGHVVSFQPTASCANGLPNTAQMAAYLIPGLGTSPGPLADPRGVSAAGGVVGFTESGFASLNGKKVGLLVPSSTMPFTAAVETNIPKATFYLKGAVDTVTPETNTVQGFEKSSPAVPAGQFTETLLPDTGDFPLGILRDPFSPAGNFYVAVSLGGTTNHRMSRVEFLTDPNPAPVPDSTTPALVTGGGTIGTDATAPVVDNLIKDPNEWAPGGGMSNFGLNVHRKVTAGPIWGNLNYLNKVTGDHVKSTAILYFLVGGNSATIKGTCTNAKTPLLPCSFELTIQDNGNPGRGRDTFNIMGVGFTPNSGTLSGGNIQIHRRR